MNFPEWPEDIETSRDHAHHMKKLVTALKIAWDALEVIDEKALSYWAKGAMDDIRQLGRNE